MAGRLAGKTTLITAAGAGIGRASAIAFANEGATVYATDVNDKLFDNLDGVYQQMVPKIVSHFEMTEIDGKKGLDAWISGRKAFQSITRQNLPRFEIEDGRLKINPLGDWTKDDLEAYFEAHDLPRHPLEAQGYLSVGCQPCTSIVAPGEDPRAGRWRGWDKTECGIHGPAGTPGSDEGELPPGYEPAF